MIRFWCSSCNGALEVPEEQGGLMLHCPNCGQPARVPTLLPTESASRSGAAERRWDKAGGRFLANRVWNMVSPTTLLLALVLFPLPWIEIQCARPTGDSGTRILAEQSGLQAAYGGFSESPSLKNSDVERQKRFLTEANQNQETTLPKSGWMNVYPLLLVGGIGAGFLLRRQFLRSLLLIASGASASLMLIIQGIEGMPLERALVRATTPNVSVGEIFKVQSSPPKLFESHYTIWFWLSIALVLSSVAAALPWRSTWRSASRSAL